MNHKSKLIFAFAAGAAIGAGIMALMGTEKGKQFREKAKGKFSELKDELTDNVEDLEKDLSDALGKFGKKANPETKAWLNKDYGR